MDTKAAEKLRVLEIPYRNLKRTLYRREFDDYKLCGTYYKAGIPFEVTQVTYPEEDYPKGYGEFYPKEPTAYSIAYGALNSQICAAAKTAFQAGEMVLLTGGGVVTQPPQYRDNPVMEVAGNFGRYQFRLGHNVRVERYDIVVFKPSSSGPRSGYSYANDVRVFTSKGDKGE